jgi:hypothetical protein
MRRTKQTLMRPRHRECDSTLLRDVRNRSWRPRRISATSIALLGGCARTRTRHRCAVDSNTNREHALGSAALTEIESTSNARLSVGLRDTLKFVLLLDRVAFRRPLRCVQELVGEACGNTARGLEHGLPRSLGDGRERLVDPAEWGDVARLSTDGAADPDSSGVLPSATVLDCPDEDDERVLSGAKVDEVKCLTDDADRHELFAGIAAMLHQIANEALDERAVHLVEALPLIASGSMRNNNLMLLVDRNIVHKRMIERVPRNIRVGQLTEQLDFVDFKGRACRSIVELLCLVFPYDVNY